MRDDTTTTSRRPDLRGTVAVCIGAVNNGRGSIIGSITKPAAASPAMRF